MFSKGAICLLTAGALALSWAMPAHAMNKAELVEAMASNAGLSKADSKRALDGFINATSSSLREGDRVVLRNFGAFGVTDRIMDSSGETSMGEVDFVAGRAFVDSDDHAPAYAFRLEIGGAEDGIIHYLDDDDDGDGIPTTLASGSGGGVLKKGDRVALMAGDEFVHEAKVMAVLVHRSQADGGGGDCIAVFTSASGGDKPLWCWGDNSSSRDTQGDDNPRQPDSGPQQTQQGGGAGGSILVCEADGEARGVLLSGVRAEQLRPGMTIVKRSENPLYEERPRADSNPLYGRASGETGGGIVREMDLIEMMVRESGLGERTVISAYNALLNIIVDEVNAGGFVDMAGFGRFGSEAVAVVQIVDPCAGDPEACLQDIDDPELLREILTNDFVENEVTVAIGEGDLDDAVETAKKASKRSARTGRNPQTGKEIQIAAGAGGSDGSAGEATERTARTGRNPQTGKEIKIAAKNKVKFKAGADLSKSVN
jgi:DNA-binding protein HU-beta